MPKSKKKQPSHDEISHRATQLWKERGSPAGQDREIWLDAESQLQAAIKLEADKNHGHAPDTHVHAGNNGHGKTKAAAESAPPSPEPDKTHARADQQKQAARAPQVPQHTGPAPKPPVSGKPIYPKPHSS